MKTAQDTATGHEGSSEMPERVLRDLIVERRSIDRLIPYIRNARTHSEEQIAQVAASIVEFGWTNPILVGADGVIIAGHARLLAARKLGMTEVPVIVLEHLTETQRRALVLADNRLALNAGWDEEMLRVELESLQEDGFDLDIVGFTDDEIEDLLRDSEQLVEGGTDEDSVPETPETAVTVPGDVWVLGEHRLLCGDSTQIEAVEKVLAGGLADMVFTDPPYNVNYGATMKDKLRGKKRKIANDNLGAGFDQFLRDACANMLAVTKGAIYICMSPRSCTRCTGRSPRRAATGPRSLSGRRTRSRWAGRIINASTNRFFTAGRKAPIISGAARGTKATCGSSRSRWPTILTRNGSAIFNRLDWSCPRPLCETRRPTSTRTSSANRRFCFRWLNPPVLSLGSAARNHPRGSGTFGR
jgi:hypothetical protein